MGGVGEYTEPLAELRYHYGSAYLISHPGPDVWLAQRKDNRETLRAETAEERTGAVLTVARPILQLGGKLHEEPTAKSRAGDRLVFLDHGTAELLRAHAETQGLERQFAGEAWQDNDLIFCQPDGRPWNPDYVSKRFKRLAAGAGVPVVKLHEGGRHTGNSLMYDAEVRQDIVMRAVGHASKEISQRYNHPMIEAHLAAAGQVSALVRKARS